MTADATRTFVRSDLVIIGGGATAVSLAAFTRFAGLVIVAIAGNAVENVVGVQLAAKNRSEYAFSVVINSPLQIALVLAPVLVILSEVLGLIGLSDHPWALAALEGFADNLHYVK